MDMNAIGKKAQYASRDLVLLSTKQKNDLLLSLAKSLDNRKQELFDSNKKDIELATKNNLKESLIERLTINEKVLNGIITGLKKVVDLEDPIGKTLESKTRPNGLLIKKVTVPLGVIGIIYESRPNVTVDAFALAFKANNAVILKGGKEAYYSNTKLTEIIKDTLETNTITKDAISLFTPSSREETKELMRCNKYVDVLIPRGSIHLINAVLKESTVPVIETGAGNCHVYVDKNADIEMALSISENAKISRPSVCNSCETILVHKDIATSFLTKLENTFKNNVKVLGDKETCDVIKDATLATEQDFHTEFNDYIVTVKIVNSLQEAISHINKYSTSHSEAIVTKDNERAKQFLTQVDSAAVYHNASTRYTDGFEFGYGAEIGISTQKLHVRGPMGLESLTSYKYIIHGNGQVRWNLLDL